MAERWKRGVMKRIAIVFTTLLLLLASSWLASPYWASYRIHQALVNNDAELLSSYVDYPQLRANLKPQIETAILKKMGQPSEAAWWGKLQHQVAEKLSDQLVDWVVSPNGILLILQGKAGYESKLWQAADDYLSQMAKPVEKWFDRVWQWIDPQPEQVNPVQLAPIQVDSSTAAQIPNFETHYQDLQHFQIDVPYQKQKLSIQLQRVSGWTWKVIAVQLPQ